MIQCIERKPDLLIAEALPSLLKIALRAGLLAERVRFASMAERTRVDVKLAAQLTNILQRYAPRCVGLFCPVYGEFDARYIIAHWLYGDTARRAALPVIVAPRRPMIYHTWTPDSPMREGRYKISIPIHKNSVVPDMLLVPCLGFDASRYRLGYGGGYFDRTLAAWPTHASLPVTVGIAYECSKVNLIPHETHDIPLDIIVTNINCY
ncbi:5-formyltetrahydrofolate cyclo-ligase [Candidatus Vallotia cooleyia]|uniref:5-formyltetrahydrofolate cyclo-ligase n=1 Tax=Candidatus Vallotiella adelgis TaxID=1177211 RepID=UPI001D025402|nr:5-formyltetrahydrofolate cyclo-ligase [Candidatus Vallotia cooleyia]UDG82571.1 hypothetical protein GJV44_00865 [Candidatus Vallotia cooleyia]